MNLTITEGMVLALLKKGMIYEIEDCEMEYDIKVPLGVFGFDDEEIPQQNVDVQLKMTIGKFKLEISDR